MQLVIWNEIETDRIDVILLEGLIKIKINDKTIFTREANRIEDYDVYNEILEDIEEINIAYYTDDIEEFKRLSKKFFEKLKSL